MELKKIAWNYSVLWLVLLLILVGSFTLKGFTSSVGTIFDKALIVFPAATGVGLSIMVGEIDLTPGGSIGFLGSLFAGLIMLQGVDPILAGIFIVGLGGVIGAVNGVLIARYKLSSFLITVIMMFLMMGADLAHSQFNIWLEGHLTLQNLVGGSLMSIPNSVFLLLLIFVPLFLWRTRTKLGRYFRVVGENPRAAEEVGISVEWTKFFAFVAAGALYGLTSIFVVSEVSGAILYSGQYMLISLLGIAFLSAAIHIPGKQNVIGLLIAAFFFTTVPRLLTIGGAPYFSIDIAKGGLLVCVLIATNLITKRTEIKQPNLQKIA